MAAAAAASGGAGSAAAPAAAAAPELSHCPACMAGTCHCKHKHAHGHSKGLPETCECPKEAGAHGAGVKVHHEKDLLIVDVFPEEGIEASELTEAIQAVHIPNVKWTEEFKKEEVAYGIWKLRVGALITDAAVSTDLVEDTLVALHGAHAKKLVRSVAFESFDRVA